MVMLCYCYGCCISRERRSITAAVPARREEMCLQFLRLLPSSHLLPASQLAPSLPWVPRTGRTVWRGETAGTLSRISGTPDFASLSHSNLGSVTPKVLLFLLLVGEWHQSLLSSARNLRFLSPYCSQTQKLPILLLTHFQNLFSTSPFSLTWANSSFDLLPKIIMKQSIPSVLVFLHANLPELS